MRTLANRLMATNLLIAGPTSRASKRKYRRAFSLLELIVVMAMLVFGALLFAPALARTKTNTHGIQCMNNLRQFMGAWTMYAVDHSEQVVNNFDVPGTDFGSGKRDLSDLGQ